jgi:hypothetical protein
MRIPSILLPLLVLPVLVVVPQTPAAAHRASAGYATYVACSTKKSAPASHSCGKNQPKTAFFTSKSADATYKICVKFPGRAERLCANQQQADKGEKSPNSITSTKAGKHTVTWYVDGDRVGRFVFRVRSG